MNLFSIIIPMYNLQSYIKCCLESILSQKFHDYEVIIIDDGSTDNSYSICQLYTKMNDNFKLYKKDNGGVSSARNYGRQLATGKFILFLDGDDFITPNALRKYADVLIKDDYDIVVCAKYTLHEGKKSYEPHALSKYKNISNAHLLELIFMSDILSGAPWQYLYKRSKVEEDNIIFDKNYINGEDADFLFKFLSTDKKFLICDEPLVVYREMRPGSTTHVMSDSAIESALRVIEKWYEIYYDNEAARKYFSHQYCKVIFQYDTDLSGIDRVVNTIRKEIVMDSNGIKYWFTRVVWSILGYRKGNKLLKTIKRRLLLNT